MNKLICLTVPGFVVVERGPAAPAPEGVVLRNNQRMRQLRKIKSNLEALCINMKKFSCRHETPVSIG